MTAHKEYQVVVYTTYARFVIGIVTVQRPMVLIGDVVVRAFLL